MSEATELGRPCGRCSSTRRNKMGRCTACQSRYFRRWYEQAKEAGFNERRAAKGRAMKAMARAQRQHTA